MKAEDRERFGVAMGVMGENFQKAPSQSLAEIYFKFLEDLSIEDFEKACTTLINTRKLTGTFPLIAEIREAARPGMQNMDLLVDHAWRKLMVAVERHGYYDSILFDDGPIHQILKSWDGWMNWSGTVTNDELKWVRKDFDKLYRAYYAMNLPRPVDHLIGYFEHQNALSGVEEFNGPIFLIFGDKPGVVFTKALPRPEAPRQIEGGRLDG